MSDFLLAFTLGILTGAGFVGIFGLTYVGARLVVRFILREDWNTGESLK